MPCSISIKYKPPKILPRTPIIMTTNHYPWRWCQQEEEAFRNRCWIWPFMHSAQDTPLVFRASEHSCKCACCAASLGCPRTHGGASPGGMPTANKPLSTGEHGNPGSVTSDDVRSRSLRDPGEGTSGCYRRQPSSPRSSSDSECSDDAEPPGCSSTSASRDIRCYGTVTTRNTGDGAHNTEPSDVSTMEPSIDNGSDGHARRTDAPSKSGKQPFKRRHGAALPDTPKPHSSTSLGLRLSSSQEEALPLYAKQPRVDREVGAIVTTLRIPSSQDWQRYLAFLLKRYG